MRVTALAHTIHMRPLKWIPVIPLILACPQRSAVWIEPGSTSTNLVFRIADKRGGTGRAFIGVFRVDPCIRDTIAPWPRPMWGAGITGIAGEGDGYLARVRYGDMPPGYEKLINQADTALTLTPGCYQATVSGTGRTVFDVLPDGSVRERPPGSLPQTPSAKGAA